jgi:broad specificity phosphatase PhoE
MTTGARAWLVRHGETPWSKTGQHTSVTDLALTDAGRDQARAIGAALTAQIFARVLTSPLSRARDTCVLAGLGDRAEVAPDLHEWRYGEYEGLTTKEIRARVPGWLLFRDGCPGGESPEDVSLRADRLVAAVRESGGAVALFGHGHIFRVLAARWLGLPVAFGAQLLLDTASESVLGAYEGVPALERWNVTFATSR